MTIAIWQSYACNNSSSYRLIARFRDAETAAQVAAELQAFFKQHAEQIDERLQAADYSEDASEAQQALAAKYGFEWGTGFLVWGDEAMTGDEPEVILHDTTLIVYHGYCGGGLGPGVPNYLAAHGATGIDEAGDDVTVSLLFRHTRGRTQLDEELDRFFDVVANEEEEDIAQPLYMKPVPMLWPRENQAYGNVSVFRDSGTVGLHLTVHPHDLQAISKWIADRMIENVSFQVGTVDDEPVFRAIRHARCRSCDGPLDYLDPRLHDIETPQLVCKPCGGLYDVSAFLIPEGN